MHGGRGEGVPVADIAIAVIMTVIACLVGMQYLPVGWGLDPVPNVLTMLIFLPLAIRRRAPVVAFAVTMAALTAFLAFGYTQLALNFWGPILVLYSVAAARPPRTTAVCYVVVVPVMLWAALESTLPWYLAIGEAVLIPPVAWAIGNVGRQLQLRNQQLAVATEQLRIEQELRTERALTEERLRIARELHDVVAHHMSVIAVQTGLAGYVFDDDPPTARAAVNTIAATSREALQEMRRLLMLLRTDDDPGDTALNLAHLPELIDRMATTGLPVVLDMRPADVGHLPSGMQLCAYRIVQEALTNVIKHAGLVTTNVLVRYENEQLTVQIANQPGAAPGDSNGAGHGLINMRERAALYQGTLTAGPRGDGAFMVELMLPANENGRADGQETPATI